MPGTTPLDYLAPRQLEIAPESIRRVQLIGGCIFDSWRDALAGVHPGDMLDVLMFNHQSPGLPPDDCDMRIVQVPLRTLCNEWVTMPLGLTDEAPYAHVLEAAQHTITHFLDAMMADAAGVPTFLLNYFVPQHNPFGRLFPRYDLRNPIFLIESFNRLLEDTVARFPGVHVLDADRVSAVYGRRFVQDDAFWVIAHNGFMNDSDSHLDQDRFEAEEPVSARYGHDTAGFVRLLWAEAVAMLRTIRGTDRIKMVCVDLDDTLWRGVMAEQGEADFGAVEGWPIGMAEALSILRKRGVILAIVSKNDAAFIEAVFPRLFGDRLPLSSFSIRQINWRPKPDNLREVIAQANVLAEAVLFIDDNPAERAQAQAAIPGLRVLGGPHLDWRRILLWSPELQTSSMTEESLLRNDMIAAQLTREEERATTPADDFLAGLEVRAELGIIASCDHPRFSRALELLNKTNQFNTTGRRWTRSEAEHAFAEGVRWTFALAADRFTRYGLVALASVRGERVEQIVMSCRIFGLGVEYALIAEIARAVQGRSLSALLIETERNGPCRNIFTVLGWTRDGDVWSAHETAMTPSHIVTVRGE